MNKSDNRNEEKQPQLNERSSTAPKIALKLQHAAKAENLQKAEKNTT